VEKPGLSRVPHKHETGGSNPPSATMYFLGPYNAGKKEHSIVDEDGNPLATIKIAIADFEPMIAEVGDTLFPETWSARIEWIKEETDL
jgi:predicted RNA binding protein with dsRBD fold (UPF0201 family)